MKLNNCGGNGSARELGGLEMVVRDCGDDSTVGVGGWCRVRAAAVGAKEVKEWQRPGCWVFLFILSLIHSFNKFSLSAFYVPGLF